MTLRPITDALRLRRALPEPKTRRTLRVAAGITQSEVAEAVGVSRGAVCRWEAGSREPRGRTRRQYAEVLALLARETSVGSEGDDSRTLAVSRRGTEADRPQGIVRERRGQLSNPPFSTGTSPVEDKVQECENPAGGPGLAEHAAVMGGCNDTA